MTSGTVFATSLLHLPVSERLTRMRLVAVTSQYDYPVVRPGPVGPFGLWAPRLRTPPGPSAAGRGYGPGVVPGSDRVPDGWCLSGSQQDVQTPDEWVSWVSECWPSVIDSFSQCSRWPAPCRTTPGARWAPTARWPNWWSAETRWPSSTRGGPMLRWGSLRWFSPVWLRCRSVVRSGSPVFWRTARKLYLDSATPRSLTLKVTTIPVCVSTEPTRCCMNSRGGENIHILHNSESTNTCVFFIYLFIYYLPLTIAC